MEEKSANNDYDVEEQKDGIQANITVVGEREECGIGFYMCQKRSIIFVVQWMWKGGMCNELGTGLNLYVMKYNSQIDT